MLSTVTHFVKIIGFQKNEKKKRVGLYECTEQKAAMKVGTPSDLLWLLVSIFLSVAASLSSVTSTGSVSNWHACFNALEFESQTVLKWRWLEQNAAYRRKHR